MTSDDKYPPCKVLEDIFKTGEVVMPSGERQRSVAGISPKHSWALYDLVLKNRPETVIEIGMAQGVSTLSILSALAQTGGKLISIDPYIGAGWHRAREAALEGVRRAGYEKYHEYIDALSIPTLEDMAEEGSLIDFAYIDGDHSYEAALGDAKGADRILNPEGILGFNDVGKIEVYKAMKKVVLPSRYAEVDAGLNPDYSGRNALIKAGRKLLGRGREDRYFRKLSP